MSGRASGSDGANDDMSTKPILALVSGANRGIGLAIATGLARQGAQVLLGCREIGKGEAACNALRAEGLPVRPVELDTTSAASVTRLAEMIQQGYGYLDALVNNAGIGVDHDPMLTAADRLRRTMSVNVLGPLLLTDAMVPLLEASGRGCIVNVSSELASFGLRSDPNWAFAGFAMPIYQASKAALNALTLSYAGQLRDRKIKVNAICPGYTATEATNYAGTRTPDQAAVVAIRYALLGEDGPTGSFANEQGALPW
jgi:NAD(P)-dependent dehydrogenase (short-subunit alcohol dehydrogenase family)